MESTPCTLPGSGFPKGTTSSRRPRCQRVPANGEAAARAVAPPRRARGVMSLPSGGRGGALRAAAHCARPVPPPLPDTAGGPHSRSRCCSAWAGRPCTHPPHVFLAPSPAAPIPAVLAPGRLDTVPEGCAARAVRTEHPSPSGTALRPSPLHPSRELPCAGRVASTHPSVSGLPCAPPRGQHPARRAGAAAPSPAIPGVRRPGAAAASHRR